MKDRWTEKIVYLRKGGNLTTTVKILQQIVDEKLKIIIFFHFISIIDANLSLLESSFQLYHLK